MTPERIIELQCEYRRQLAEYVVGVVRSGMNYETFWDKYPMPLSWLPNQKASARKVVDDAYMWKGTPFEYGSHVRDACMVER